MATISHLFIIDLRLTPQRPTVMFKLKRARVTDGGEQSMSVMVICRSREND